MYNNGFAGGIVAIFLVPVVQSISDRRARARGELVPVVFCLLMGIKIPKNMKYGEKRKLTYG